MSQSSSFTVPLSADYQRAPYRQLVKSASRLAATTARKFVLLKNIETGLEALLPELRSRQLVLDQG